MSTQYFEFESKEEGDVGEHNHHELSARPRQPEYRKKYEQNETEREIVVGETAIMPPSSS
jgi:hypothetical protein